MVLSGWRYISNQRSNHGRWRVSRVHWMGGSEKVRLLGLASSRDAPDGKDFVQQRVASSITSSFGKRSPFPSRHQTRIRRSQKGRSSLSPQEKSSGAPSQRRDAFAGTPTSACDPAATSSRAATAQTPCRSPESSSRTLPAVAIRTAVLNSTSFPSHPARRRV